MDWGSTKRGERMIDGGWMVIKRREAERTWKGKGRSWRMRSFMEDEKGKRDPRRKEEERIDQKERVIWVISQKKRKP